MMYTIMRRVPLEVGLGLMVSYIGRADTVDVEATARRFCELVQEELDRVVPSEARIITLTDRVIAINIEEDDIANYMRYAESAVGELGLDAYLVDCE